KAYLFIPDDVRLRTYATQIADARRHSPRRHERDGDEPADEPALDGLRHEDDRAAQLSIVTALSAVVPGEDTSSVFEADDATLDRLDRVDAAEAEGDGDAALELDLPPLPGTAGRTTAGAGADGRDPRREREELRERNARLVRDIVWATGLAHAQVNGRLNRLVGVRRVDEATVEQLRRRAQQAERWRASV